MTRPPILRSLPLLAGLLLFASVAEAGKKRLVSDAVEDALAYATTDRERAIALLTQSLADDPDPVTELYLAEQLRLAGDADGARARFANVVSGSEDADRAAAELGLALLDAADGHRPRALPVLESVEERDALATQNADRYLQLALRAANQENLKDVSAYSKKALAFAAEDPAVDERVRSILKSLADGSPAEAPAAAGDDALVRAEQAYAAGDLAQATTLAQRAAGGSGPEAERAAGLLRNLQGAAPNPARIVVLLPLTGKYESVGTQVRDALLYGYGTAPVKLDIVDSGGTPESAVAAMEKAVLQDGALAVVGPLLSDETDAVVDAAEALHVPLLSLSQSYEGHADHVWTFQAMYTRADQVDALLQFVTGERGMDSFAVFYPDNSFGQHAAELFAAGVQAKAGTITSQAAYAPDETSLISYAKKLGTRSGSLGELRSKASAAGGNPNTVVVPPIIDFDAIFVPESANRTPMAVAALAYEEFPMGDYMPQGSSHRVPLLGLSSWNTPNLITQGNEYTRNSLFPDVFCSTCVGEGDPFVTAYKASTGHTPTALEAAVVDAGKLLAAAVRTAPDHRGEMREALLGAQVSDSVTGADRFHADTRRAERTMRILTITRTTLEQVGTVALDGR